MSGSLSYLEMVAHSGLVVTSVLVILVLSSLASWTIIFRKVLHLRRAQRESVAFLDTFWRSKRLDSIYAATEEMPLSPVDVRAVVRDVCSETRSLAELRHICIRESLGDEAAIISGNRPALHRLFLVLLDNALKYSRAGGDVHVTVDCGDSRVSIAIEDFGTGISAADLPHIFKRFYQADRARSDGGHGLGLSLAESIARAHGAAIEVSSTEGASTVFQVVFVSRDARPELASFSQPSACSATIIQVAHERTKGVQHT